MHSFLTDFMAQIYQARLKELALALLDPELVLC
jgi:hypothetical protein